MVGTRRGVSRKALAAEAAAPEVTMLDPVEGPIPPPLKLWVASCTVSITEGWAPFCGIVEAPNHDEAVGFFVGQARAKYGIGVQMAFIDAYEQTGIGRVAP